MVSFPTGWTCAVSLKDCGDVGKSAEVGVFNRVLRTGMRDGNDSAELLSSLAEALVTIEYGVTVPFLKPDFIVILLAITLKIMTK